MKLLGPKQSNYVFFLSNLFQMYMYITRNKFYFICSYCTYTEWSPIVFKGNTHLKNINHSTYFFWRKIFCCFFLRYLWIWRKSTLYATKSNYCIKADNNLFCDKAFLIYLFNHIVTWWSISYIETYFRNILMYQVTRPYEYIDTLVR